MVVGWLWVCRCILICVEVSFLPILAVVVKHGGMRGPKRVGGVVWCVRVCVCVWVCFGCALAPRADTDAHIAVPIGHGSRVKMGFRGRVRPDRGPEVVAAPVGAHEKAGHVGRHGDARADDLCRERERVGGLAKLQAPVREERAHGAELDPRDESVLLRLAVVPCPLYTSPSPRTRTSTRLPSFA